MRDSLRLALWWFLPRDGDFRLAADGLHYYLARQGRRVVLRGGNVTSPLHESRLLWIHEPHRSQPSHVPPSHPQHLRRITQCPGLIIPCPGLIIQCPGVITKCPETVKMHPEIAPLRSLVMCACVPLLKIYPVLCGTTQPSHLALMTVPPVPRNNVTDGQINSQKTVSPTPKKKRNLFYRREMRARERAERERAFNHDARWATQSSGAPSSTLVPDRLTQLGLLHGDPISAMRPAVYPPVTLEGRPSTNDNSSLQFDQELGESAGLLPGLFKPAVPDPQHHTWTSSFIANSLDQGPPSPARTSEASSSSSRSRTGIVYPLQPRQRRPDVCIMVEASLPEPAALHRLELRPTREAPTGLSRSHRRLSRKRRRNRSSAIYRPAKRSPPRGLWCDL